jgi:hypothetical protein
MGGGAAPSLAGAPLLLLGTPLPFSGRGGFAGRGSAGGAARGGGIGLVAAGGAAAVLGSGRNAGLAPLAPGGGGGGGLAGRARPPPGRFSGGGAGGGALLNTALPAPSSPGAAAHTQYLRGAGRPLTGEGSAALRPLLAAAPLLQRCWVPNELIAGLRVLLSPLG